MKAGLPLDAHTYLELVVAPKFEVKELLEFFPADAAPPDKLGCGILAAVAVGGGAGGGRFPGGGAGMVQISVAVAPGIPPFEGVPGE